MTDGTLTLTPQEFRQVFVRDDMRWRKQFDRHGRPLWTRISVADVVRRWVIRQIIRQFKPAGVVYGPVNIDLEYDPASRQTRIMGWVDVASPVPGHEGEIYAMRESSPGTISPQNGRRVMRSNAND